MASGIACPAFSASLGYFDSYRRATLPANLTQERTNKPLSPIRFSACIVTTDQPLNQQQAQRDFFGGHTYERVDREGWFHCAWTDSHKDIGDANQRTGGELSAVTASGH